VVVVGVGWGVRGRERVIRRGACATSELKRTKQVNLSVESYTSKTHLLSL